MWTIWVTERDHQAVTWHWLPSMAEGPTALVVQRLGFSEALGRMSWKLVALRLINTLVTTG